MTISRTARIGSSVVLGEDVTIEDYVILGSDDPDSPTEVGDGSVIRSGTIIYENVEIGPRVRTGHHVLIREHTRVGSDVTVGTHTVIDGSSSIGDSVSIQSGVYIPSGTDIGDHCFLGPNAVLTNDKSMGSYVRGIRDRTSDLRGPTLERAVRVGANATILPEVNLGEESVVGAGAVVIEDVPAQHVVVGVPARFLTMVSSDQLHPSVLGSA